MEEFKITDLIDGRPEVVESEKERRCYDILEELNINYQRVEYNYFPNDIENLKIIDKTLQVDGIKNLIFKNKSKSQFYFIIIPRESRFDEKYFRNKFELPKISMAKNEELQELLKTYSGAVSIMELEEDKDNVIKVFIEESILSKEYFRFHPNENKSTVRIKMDDLKNKLMPYLKHDINVL